MPVRYRAAGRYFGVGLGTDTGGFAALPGPAEDAAANPLRYPFRLDGAVFRIGMDGGVKEVEMSGPDETIKKCMEKLIRAGKYPMSKHGHEVQMGIVR